MMTTKKRRRLHSDLVVVAALGTLLTACGPPGARQLRQGEEFIQAGQFADAIVVLREATRILADAPRPVQAKAWNLLGLACQDNGQLDAAAKAYGEALKLDRNNAAIDYNLGCLRSQQTNFPGAIDYLTTYVTLRPRDVQGFLRLGTAHFHYAQERTGQERIRFLEAARHDFESAEKLSVSADAANALGVLELQRRSPGAESIRAAATNFALALHRNRHYAPAMLNLAIVSQEYLNQPREALKLYNDYLAVSPPAPHANEVARLAHDLDLNLRITITPQVAPAQAPAPAPASAPRPAPPSARATVAPSNPVAVMPRPRPAESPPALAVVPAPTQAVVPVPAPAPTPVSSPAPPPQPPPRISPPPATVQAPPETSPTVNTSNSVPEPVVADTTSPPRKKFGERLNPLRWFEGKPRTSEGVSASGAAPQAEAPPVPAGTRYDYPPPVTPIPGDRAQAKRLEAEALRARQAGDLTQCIRAYEDAMAADPTYFEARYGLGLAAMKAGDYATALQALHRALTLQGDSAEARYAFAWVLQKRGYTEDAVRELGKLLEQHPDEARAHLLLGNLYAGKLGQPKLAREHYTQALALDPNNKQAANVRAWLKQNP